MYYFWQENMSALTAYPNSLKPLLQRHAKTLLYVLGLIPAAWTLHLALSDQLGADPVKTMERTFGLVGLRFLVIGLTITPLRRIGGPNLIGYRRAIGLLAFFYAVFHVTTYVWLDQSLALGLIWRDVIKRPYITVGLLSFLILIPLAVTSNNDMIKRIGGKAWQKLHCWVYLAAAAAALHFVMLVKSWPAEPLIYAALVAVLLLWRVWDKFIGAPKRARARPVRA
jgi:methionine sulfoxide reductase heme-binding subunit